MRNPNPKLNLNPGTANRNRKASWRGVLAAAKQDDFMRAVRTLVLGAIVVAVCSWAAASPRQDDDLASRIRERITAAGLMEQTEAIVRYERPSGSVGENAAIDHIVATLRGDGIPVQVHEFRAWTSDPVAASVELVGAGFAPDAITAAYSGSVEGLEARIVVLGSVDDLPPIDRFTGELLSVAVPGSLSVNGAIALVQGLPMPEAAWKLERMGAVGAIFINRAERLNELITTTVWGSPSLRNRHRNPSLPVAQVRNSDGQRLIEAAAAGAKVRLSVRTDSGWRTLRLVVARIDPGHEAPYVLLGGHIDAWYHGATDEGASNAAMLELARAFWLQRDQLQRGLVVAWWPGHSNGRYAGSTWFADHAFGELTQRAIAYLNVDGIGQKDARRFSAAATASLGGLAREVIATVTADEAPVRAPGRNSDQSFNGIGLPLLQFNHSRLPEDGGYWWWHTPEDTIDKVDPQVLETDTELYAKALVRLLADPAPPIDMVAEVDALIELLEDIAGAAGEDLDLSGSLDRARKLRSQAAQLQHALAAGAGDEHAAIRLLRPLYRVLGTRSGPFHPDPAIEYGLLPGLAPARDLAQMDPASDRYGFTLIDLMRERNRLDEALETAMAVAASALRCFSHGLLPRKAEAATQRC